jgi:DNA repair protein RecO (recombination protein O)
MSEIVKTECIVLSVLDYGDTSRIAHILTGEYGKLSVIVKGAKQKSSKIGKIVFPLNVINAVFYLKENRDIQLLTEADLVSYYPAIHEDYEKLKYSLATLEIINSAFQEHEPNQRMYNGLKRIIERIAENKDASPILSFLRFFIFFLEEMGYEINFDFCNNCNEAFVELPAGFSSETGLLCTNCINTVPPFYRIDRELFSMLDCLKSGKTIFSGHEIFTQKIFTMLLKYAQFHIPGFKQINSLKM